MRTAETIRHWPKRTCLVRSQNWHLPFMVPLFVKGSLKGSGCSWECIGKNSVRFHQRMLNNYSDLAGQWRTKKCTNKPLQLKWYPYCTSLARWSLCGWDSRHMGWSKRATAAVKQLATAQQWSLGGGLLKFRTGRDCIAFQGMCPFLIQGWSQMAPGNEIYTFQHEWSFHLNLHGFTQAISDSMVFHEENPCGNPSMINPEVLSKLKGSFNPTGDEQNLVYLRCFLLIGDERFDCF